MADDGRRGYEPGARPQTVLMLIACALAGAVVAGLWQLIRWCFRSAAVADAFAMDCGGRRVDLPTEWVTPEPTWEELSDGERRRRGFAMRIGLDKLAAAR